MKKSSIWQKLVLLLMVAGMLLVWPVCIVRTEYTRTVEHEIYETTDKMATGAVLTQNFYAEESVLWAIDLVIDYDETLPTEGIFRIEIVDENGELQYEGLFPYYLVEDYTFYRILTELHLKKGDTYQYRLTNLDIAENLPRIAYTCKEQEDGRAYQTLMLDNTVIEGESFARYVWKAPYSPLNVLAVWSCLGLGGFFLWELLEQCKKKRNTQDIVKRTENEDEVGKIQN